VTTGGVIPRLQDQNVNGKVTVNENVNSRPRPIFAHIFFQTNNSTYRAPLPTWTAPIGARSRWISFVCRQHRINQLQSVQNSTYIITKIALLIYWKFHQNCGLHVFSIRHGSFFFNYYYCFICLLIVNILVCTQRGLVATARSAHHPRATADNNLRLGYTGTSHRVFL